MRNWMLAGALALSLAACKKDDDTDDPATPAPNPNADFAMTTIALSPTTVNLASLPPPDTNASVVNYPQVLMDRPANATFQAPPGFVVNLFEEDLPGARNVVVAPNGDVFVAQSTMNQISVLRDTDNDGDADQTTIWAAGGVVDRPYGMKFYNGNLYVAMSGKVIRYAYTRGQTTTAGGVELPMRYPGGGQHPYRSLALDTVAGKMYVGIGSATNVGPEDNAMRATVQQYNLDGTGGVTFAEGLRNPQALAFEPVTNKLWTYVNERDGIGDDLVPDYFSQLTSGEFYGWPYVYLAPGNRDPRAKRTSRDTLRIPDTQTPEVLFRAHSSALGVMFYTGTQFPEEYRRDAYLAMRGSWNRARGEGYKVVRVKMNAQGQVEANAYEDFVTGWQTNVGTAGVPTVFGRPMTLTMAKDGSLLVADDAGGAIWRVRYKGL